MWESFQLSFEEADIGLQTKGDGPQVLVCLHGYLQDRHLFEPLFENVPSGWRIILVDLPCFGESVWKSNTPMTQDFIQKFWQSIQARFKGDVWHLLGFSMGGKISMAIQTLENPQTQKVILIAPDGIRSNPWHRFAAETLPGKWVLKLIFRRPVPFLKLADIIYRKRWIDRMRHRVFMANFASLKNRQWFSEYLRIYGGIRLDIKNLAKNPYSRLTRWYVIWGRHDEVLSPKNVKRFRRYFPGTRIDIIEGKHLLIDHHAPEVRKILEQILWD